MADQMTFEQFRPYIQQKYAAVFAAGFALPSQVNPVLDVPVGEPLHKVVRFMAKIVANDFRRTADSGSVRLRPIRREGRTLDVRGVGERCVLSEAPGVR